MPYNIIQRVRKTRIRVNNVERGPRVRVVLIPPPSKTLLKVGFSFDAGASEKWWISNEWKIHSFIHRLGLYSFCFINACAAFEQKERRYSDQRWRHHPSTGTLFFVKYFIVIYTYTEDIVRGRKRRCTEILSSYVNDFPPFHIGPETLFACKDKPAGWPA